VKIFVSYAHANKKLVDYIERAFSIKGITIIRDINITKFKDSLTGFMKTIRESDYVLLVITKDFLESENCLIEICELVKDENYKDKILPLVKHDTGIFNGLGKAKHISYWQNKYENLENIERSIPVLSKEDITNELKRIAKIEMVLPNLLSSIADMKCITFHENISNSNFIEIADHIGVDLKILDVCENFMQDIEKYSQYIEFHVPINPVIISYFHEQYFKNLDSDEDNNYFFHRLWSNAMVIEDKKMRELLYHLLIRYIDLNRSFCYEAIKKQTDVFANCVPMERENKDIIAKGSGYDLSIDGFSVAFRVFFDNPELYHAFHEQFKNDFRLLCELNVNYYLLAYYLDETFKCHLNASKELLKKLSINNKYTFYGDYAKFDIKAIKLLLEKVENKNVDSYNAFILDNVIGNSRDYYYSEDILIDLLPVIIYTFTSDDIRILLNKINSNIKFTCLWGGDGFGKYQNDLRHYIKKYIPFIVDKVGNEYISSLQQISIILHSK